MTNTSAGGGGQRPITCSEDASPPRDANGEARVLPVGVSPERSWEAKAPRAADGDNCDGHGVGALSISAPLNSRSVDNGAARGSPAVGGLDLPIGVLNR